MKERPTDIDRMIMESHYLTALEIESKAEISLPDMEREDYIAKINSLSDTISQFKDLISYLKAAHESDAVEKSKLHELITTLTNEVCSLRKELAKQNDRNNCHNKHTFGKSSLKSTTHADNKPSREEDNYRHDGRYDIDNTEAERKIRPLTIGRKNTLFFGSEENVEVATTYYTLIETCKINGLAPLDYLTHVFRQLMTGNKDYESLLPGKFALQTT